MTIKASDLAFEIHHPRVVNGDENECAVIVRLKGVPKPSGYDPVRDTPPDPGQIGRFAVAGYKDEAGLKEKIAERLVDILERKAKTEATPPHFSIGSTVDITDADLKAVKDKRPQV